MSLRRARQQALAAQIGLFTRHRRRYGSPRITEDLCELGWRVSENTVAEIMREQGLVARGKRRRWWLTQQDRNARKAPDLLRREFGPPPEPNVHWCGDLTDIPCAAGQFYLASVLDLHSRRCVGFAMGAHHDPELALAGLCTAIAVRGGDVAGVIFHTDQGGEGGIKRSSQHLDDGGVMWRRSRSVRRRAGVARRVAVGSGRRIGRCGRRCVHLDGRSPRVQCSGCSGA